MSKTQDPRSSTSKHRAKGRFGRILSSSGLLLLCICFFLPQFRGCVPAEIAFAERTFPSVTWLGFFLPFYFAFVMAFLYGIRLAARAENVRQAVAEAGCIFCIATLTLGSFMLTSQVMSWFPLDEGKMDLPVALWLAETCLAWASTLAAILVVALVSVVRKLPICVSIVGLCSLGYGLYWGIGFYEDTCFGLWLSIAACALISAGGVCEAIRLRSAQPS